MWNCQHSLKPGGVTQPNPPGTAGAPWTAQGACGPASPWIPHSPWLTALLFRIQSHPCHQPSWLHHPSCAFRSPHTRGLRQVGVTDLEGDWGGVVPSVQPQRGRRGGRNPGRLPGGGGSSAEFGGKGTRQREGIEVLLWNGASQKSTCAWPDPGMQLVKSPTATSKDCRCPGRGRGLRVNLQQAISKQRIPGMQRPPGEGAGVGWEDITTPCWFTPAAWAGEASTQVTPEQGAAAAFCKEPESN